MAGLATPHPKSKYWTAIFYDGAGMKVRRSTKQTDRRKAMKVASEWEEAAKAGREKRLTETQARKVVAEILKRTTGETMHFHTAREWFDLWVKGKRGAVAAKSLVKYEQVKDDFLKHLGQRADLSIAAIGVKDVQSFKDALTDGGRAPSTVNQTVRKVLSAPFAAAHRLGYIDVNPCAGIEAIRDTAAGGRKPFTNVEVRTLLKTADEAWRGAILFGYHTALRLGDIIGLTWEIIDLTAEYETLRIQPRKTEGRANSELLIPLHPDVSAWLRAQPRGIGKAPVFPSLIGRGTGGRNGLSNQFLVLMDKAGVKGELLREKHKAGRETRSLSFHSLRHSCVSAMANAGVAPELRKKLSGHADDRSHTIYTHHTVETLRAAVRQVPGVLAGS